MKRTLLVIAILSLSVCSQLRAQKWSTVRSNLKYPVITDIRNSIFFQVGVSPMSQYIVTGPLETNLRKHGLFQSEIPEFTKDIAGGFGIDLRFNILEYNDIASLSINFPLAYSIGVQRNLDHIDRIAHLPIILQYNMYLNATKYGDYKSGFHFGVGYMMLKVDYGFDGSVGGISKYTVLRMGVSDSYQLNSHSIDLIIGINPRKYIYYTAEHYKRSGYYNMYFGMRYYRPIFTKKTHNLPLR